MTTPGGQLTPGDEPEIGDPPQYGVPSGAHVGDAGSPQSFKDLNTLTKDEAKRRMQQPLEGMFGRQSNALVLFANTLLGIVQGAVDLIVGTVDAIVGGIGAIIESIGSLFGATRRDVSAVDAARVAAENAIVDNLGDAVDQLDEIQRAGGAYMDYPKFMLGNGGKTPHVLPLNTPMTLQEGTTWTPPVSPLTFGGLYNSVESNYARMAQASGYLELIEPGFWRIDFQAAVLQASSYYAEPSEVWCYVTPANSPYLPLGAPGLDENGNAIGATQCVTRHRSTGTRSVESDLIYAFGRSSAYVDQLETGWSGGNTIAGTVFALIPSGGYKVTMACSAYEHFSGGSSTFVMATKVNSQSLRDEIEGLKTKFAISLPGQSVPLNLNDATISAMVAQSEHIEASPIVVPPYGGVNNG